MPLCGHKRYVAECIGCRTYASDPANREHCDRFVNVKKLQGIPDGIPQRTVSVATATNPRPAVPPCTAGTRLKELIAALKIDTKVAGCKTCADLALAMDHNGLDWCKASVEAIAKQLRTNAKNLGVMTFAKAGWNSILSGLAFKVDPLDPFPGLVLEAIRLAELDAAPLAP